MLDGPGIVSVMGALQPVKARLLLHYLGGQGSDPKAQIIRHVLFEARQDEFLDAPGFDLLVVSNGEPAFRSAAGRYIQRSTGQPALWRALVRDDQPLQQLVDHWRQHGGLTLEQWLQHPDVLLSTRGRITAGLIPFLVFRAPFEGWMEERQGDATILQWCLTHVPVDHRSEWLALYLTELARRTARKLRYGEHGWPLEHQILEHIYDSHREPDPEHPFWAPIDAAVQQRFRLWQTDRELTRHLEGGERTAFWRSYLADMVSSELNVDSTVVIIRFEAWAAIVYRRAGNLTYLIRRRDSYGLQQYNKSQVTQHVKDRIAPLGSYAHRGYAETWQAKAARAIAEVQQRLAAEAREAAP
jgi:hypothetical protein